MRLFLAAVIALAACTPTHAQTPHTAASARLERETVALVTKGGVQIRVGEDGELQMVPQPPRAYCSGVWVGEDRILTANHCVKELEVGDRVTYATRGDVEARAKDELEALRFGSLEARDLEHDLALLRVRLAPEHLVAALATPTVGQVVATMGHPLGLWWSYSAGEVAAIRMVDVDETGAGMWVVQATAPISPGNSGGGLFDEDGNLIGMADFYYPRGECVNMFVHSQYIEALLAKAQAQ